MYFGLWWYLGEVLTFGGICLYNSFQASIGMAPYEALYGRPCRSPISWSEVGEAAVLGPEMVRETTEKVQIIKNRLLTA